MYTSIQISLNQESFLLARCSICSDRNQGEQRGAVAFMLLKMDVLFGLKSTVHHGSL